MTTEQCCMCVEPTMATVIALGDIPLCQTHLDEFEAWRQAKGLAPVAVSGEGLVACAEQCESDGDATEGVWLRRMASLVDRKGAAWVLRALGGSPVGANIDGYMTQTWTFPMKGQD